MARILIRDLTVETEYGVQVRSALDGHVSEWSNYLNFTTVKDTVAPADPTNLTFDVVGSSFVATWDAPTLNMDGSDLNGDLKDYVVTLTVAANPAATPPTIQMTREYFTEKTSFELTAEMNSATFFGYEGAMTIKVQSRDFKNNVSTPGATKTAAKAKPNPATAQNAYVKGTSFIVEWTPPTQNTDGTDFDDLDHYNISITDGSYTEVYTSREPTISFTFDQVKAIFGQMKYSLSFDISVVNKVGGESTKVTATATKPPPGPPTALSWVAAPEAAFAAGWTAPNGVDDLAGYDVTLTANSISLTYRVTDTKFILTREENIRVFGTGVVRYPAATVGISVKSVDSLGQLSTAVTASATNAAPAAPTAVTATGGTDSVTVSWTAPNDSDIIRYEVYTSPTSGGALTYQGQVSDKTTQLTFTSVQYGTNFFVAVKAFDEFNSGSATAYSGASVHPNSPFTVDTTAPAATGTVTVTTPTGRTTSQSAAILINWPVSGESDLAGYQVRFSAVVTPRVWQYLDIGDKTATSTLVEGLSSGGQYVAQVRAYDTMINTPAWSAESAAGTATTSTQPPQDISSTISILTGGSLRSADYDPGPATPKGWLLSPSTLDIQQGSVNARVIKAGTMFSTQNVTYDGTTQPAWSLNLAGNMSINDAQVRGKIVVGNSGATTNNNVSVASYNYGGTGAQWAIKGDGTMEFRSAAPTANRIEFDGLGYRAYTGGTLTVDIRSDGSTHKFAGNLSGSTLSNNAGTFSVAADGTMVAKLGTIGGWTIGTSLLSNAGLRLDAANGMIDAGSGSTRIGMKAGVGFWAGSDNLNSASPFFVSASGSLYASSASLTGSFQSSNSLFSVDTGGNVTVSGNMNVYGHIEVGASSSSADAYAIVRKPSTGAWVMLDGRGSTNTAIASSSGRFSVDYDGFLTASSVNLSGAISASSGTFSGTVNANAGTFSGTIYGGEFSGSTYTGGVFRTAPSGTRIEMRGDGGFGSVDTLRFYGNGGSGWVDVRGYMGVGGDGFYINGNTQIGNTQGVIYNVGRTKAMSGSPQDVRLRAGSFSLTTSGGAATITWDYMSVVPNCVQITLTGTGSAPYSYWVTGVGNSGCTINVRIADSGGVPGAGSVVQGYYYAEAFI